MLIFQFKNGVVVEGATRLDLSRHFKESGYTSLEILGKRYYLDTDDVLFVENATLDDICMSLTITEVNSRYLLKEDSILKNEITEEEYNSLPSEYKDKYNAERATVDKRFAVNLNLEVVEDEIKQPLTRKIEFSDLEVANIMEFDFDYKPKTKKWEAYIERFYSTGSQVIDDMVPMRVKTTLLTDLTRIVVQKAVYADHDVNPYLNTSTKTIVSGKNLLSGYGRERGRNITIITDDNEYEKIQIDSLSAFDVKARNRIEAVALIESLIEQYESYFNIEIDLDPSR